MKLKIARRRLILILFAIAMILFAIWLGIILSGNCPSCILR